jgi:hypothetical protein
MSKRVARQQREYVALGTFSSPMDDGRLYEAGGVYDHDVQSARCCGMRPLEPGEHIVSCPRCGQRFAYCDDEGTAEDCCDLHFNGDDDIPSICAP